MLSIKSELAAGDELLNEDQIAAAELVAAAAEVETVGGGSRSGTPVGSSISSQAGGQRIIQVIQRPGSFSGGITSSRMRPLQQVQLSSGSLGGFNTNTALQYQGGLNSLGTSTSVLKNSPGMEFSSAKVLSGGSLFTSNLSSGFGGVSQSSQFSMGVPIGSNNVAAAAAAASAATAASQGTNAPSGSQSRKPCNCNKSHCLKLYCDCFAQGQLCQNCNCTNCMNNLQYEEERARAIKMTLDRNPMAFHPKIGRGEGERKHTKGCNCKKSGCLKNYCECYEAKISCTELCRCQGCKNTEDGMERRSLMRLSMMNQAIKSRQQVHSRKSFIGPAPETVDGASEEKTREEEEYENNWNSHPSSNVYWDRGANSGTAVTNNATAFHRYPGFFGNDVDESVNSSILPQNTPLASTSSFGLDELTAQHQDDTESHGFAGSQMTSANTHSFCDPYQDTDATASGTSEDALPHTFITWEVAEACCGCMLAQADDAERRDMLPAAQERIILEEFGRCLGQIVESASKAQPLPGYAPNASVPLPMSGHIGGGLGMHRMPPGGLGDLEVPHSRLQHDGSMSGGDENVIVDV